MNQERKEDTKKICICFFSGYDLGCACLRRLWTNFRSSILDQKKHALIGQEKMPPTGKCACSGKVTAEQIMVFTLRVFAQGIYLKKLTRQNTGVKIKTHRKYISKQNTNMNITANHFFVK